MLKFQVDRRVNATQNGTACERCVNSVSKLGLNKSEMLKISLVPRKATFFQKDFTPSLPRGFERSRCKARRRLRDNNMAAAILLEELKTYVNRLGDDEFPDCHLA